MRDIETRNDLLRLLEDFYSSAFADELIGPFFTQVVSLDLETHVPVIADFWESVLLDGRGYRKDLMQVHGRVDRLSSIRREHLERWVALFTATVDRHFSGPRAELARQRARSIATIMDIKLNHDGISTGS